jgi:pimeloyl-ACP methyl ester carboxylesterase
VVNSIRSERINVNGLDIHYLTGGQGEPLIIVHGGSDGASAWKKNIAVLSRKYTIYVPDMPGFGSSQMIKGDYYIPQMADFVDRFSRAIGLDSFYLMGHSLGGGIALNYTLRYPKKIRKLVLVSSLCLGTEIAWWIRIFSNRFTSGMLGKAAIGVFKAIKYVAKYFGPWELMSPVTRTSLHIVTRMANMTQQTIVELSRLPKVMVPTLVMWGAKDPVVPFRQAYAAARLIPDCQVRVFADAGHSVYREELHEFSRTLSGFLG